MDYGSINESNENENLIRKHNDEKIKCDLSVNQLQITNHRTLFSRLVFQWFTPILHCGNAKKNLDHDDLDLVPLPKDCSSDYVAKNFEKYWKQEMCISPTNPSLMKALFRAFGREFMYAGALKLCHDICVFVGPQVLRSMIVYLRQPLSISDHSFSGSFWHGLLLTAAVTCSQITMSLCLRHYFFKCYATGLRVRTAMITAVYRKALILSSSERQTRTLGEITNLMSIDAERLQGLMVWLHSIWSSPLQIVLALFFLWLELGASSLGGVAVIITMIPVSRKLSAWMGSLQGNLMKAKDARVELNGEVLSNMKIIKLQVWEEAFQKRILALRQTELNQLLKYLMVTILSEGSWVITPLIVSLATFGAYVWSGHTLDVASALTVLSLFDILRFPLFMLPMTINIIVEGSVSLKRVQSLLVCEEYTPVGEGCLRNIGVSLSGVSATYDSKRSKDHKDGAPVSKGVSDMEWEISLLKAQLEDAEKEIRDLKPRSSVESFNRFASSSNDCVRLDNLLCLHRVNFECKPDQLIAIVGSVGSGKSTLINSILGEVRQVAGSVGVKGKLALFPQSPFILNANVRDNILFSHVNEPVDEDLYRRCLDCCALNHDLDMLPAGDNTEIGERGITLSGGQKARVALARAVYHRANITLIDDALSAVDAHVAKHLFEKALLGELLCSNDGESRCIILVTNALQYLGDPRVDKIVVLVEGKIVEQGTYSELASKPDSVFLRMLSAIENASVATSLSDHAGQSLKDFTGTQVNNSENQVEYANSKTIEATKLMTEEVRQTGQIGLHVYESWFMAAGGMLVPCFILGSFLLYEATNVLSNWWLTYWSAHGDSGISQVFFIATYAAINISAAIADFIRGSVIALFSLRASKKLFADMLETVLHAKMSFFDTTPVGRLVNRFTKDMDIVDASLRHTMKSYVSTLFSVISCIVVITFVTPSFAICLIPMILFYLQEQSFFTLTYRELKRLDSVARSPIYALLGESVNGVAVIRAFAAQHSLFSRLIGMLDKQQHAYFLTCTAQSWLAVRLELIGTLIITFSCLSSILNREFYGSTAISAGLSGLAISYALSVTQSLSWSVRLASDMEANMVAVERIGEYTKIENEGDRITKVDATLPHSWPSDGEIVFKDVKFRYRPETPLVLKGLNLHIPAGSKVGVVGRTGAGKSTLMVALMRIVEINEGNIFIDGTDTRTIGLAKLRRNLAVIPQDPVLFSGSVRTNLDPFQEYSNEALYDVLEHVGLFKRSDTANTSTSSLSAPDNTRVRDLDDTIAEGGVNFSVGQRQLIVIARALLRGAKIVMMDEATAAIDAETDAYIQTVLRQEFAGSTCITVAHRLNTVMDSDFILVMDDGRAVEFDSPKNLLQKGGLFRDLVQKASSK